jgi:hypothetical protein
VYTQSCVHTVCKTRVSLSFYREMCTIPRPGLPACLLRPWVPRVPPEHAIHDCAVCGSRIRTSFVYIIATSSVLYGVLGCSRTLARTAYSRVKLLVSVAGVNGFSRNTTGWPSWTGSVETRVFQISNVPACNLFWISNTDCSRSRGASFGTISRHWKNNNSSFCKATVPKFDGPAHPTPCT